MSVKESRLEHILFRCQANVLKMGFEDENKGREGWISGNSEENEKVEFDEDEGEKDGNVHGKSVEVEEENIDEEEEEEENGEKVD